MDGMKENDERIVTISFPADYFNKELQNKKANFRVKMKTLHQKQLPKADDEFAKDLGKQDIGEVKKEIKTMLEKRREREFRIEYGNEIIDYLVNKNKFDIPEGLIEAEQKNSKREKKDIEQSVKTQFILEHIAVKENIRVEPEEINTRLQQVAMQYRQPVDAVRKHYQQKNLIGHLAAQIAMEKTLDFLIDKARIS